MAPLLNHINYKTNFIFDIFSVILPDTPTPIYNSGATILPVCPICISFGTKPASTAALLAPTPAFNLSASSYNILKFSPFCKPLPP